MLKSYLKIALRNLIKHKLFSVINILGLAIGITAFFSIVNYVSFEFSYDTFHENYENIYRVNTIHYTEDNTETRMAVSPPAVGPALKREFLGVVDYTRMFKMIRTVVKHNETAFRDFEIFYVDSSFLNVFTFQLLEGDKSTALNNPNSVVITKTAAEKYFGKSDPVGKILEFSNKYDVTDCVVTGVLKDIPENSLLKFDMLVSINTPSNRLGGNINIVNTYWDYELFYNYILLKPGTDYHGLETQLQSFYKRQTNNNDLLTLQPLKSIYLSPALMFDFSSGNKQIIYLLLTFAFIIIIIAWINYVNLSTAKSMERAKEVGIRKTVGSNRFALIKQFLFESTLMNLFSFLLAVLFIEISRSYFIELTGENLSYSSLTFEQWVFLSVLFIVGIILSGWYPSFVLSSFEPSSVLKGMYGGMLSNRKNLMRKSLIVFQFASSVILIIATFTVVRQIEFMQNKSLGMNIEQLLVIKSPVPSDVNKYTSDIENFKKEVLQIHSVKNAAGSYYIPGNDIRYRAKFKRVNSSGEDFVTCGFISIDENFIDTYQFNIIAGRSFSKDFGTDKQSIVINKTAALMLGLNDFENSIGRKIQTYNDRSFILIGIIEDYNHTSLRNDYQPIVFSYNDNILNYYTLRIETSDLINTISSVKNKWNQIFRGSPFVYFFMDNYFNQQYKSDRQFRDIAALFALLSIIIASLGLFGLSSYTLMKRTKEIGIRKVLGAGIPNIIYLLIKDYVYLIFVGVIIAYPAAYAICSKWLTGYAFRLELSLMIFLLPTLFILIIALTTVSFQAIKAAIANPVKSLRYE